MPLTSPGVRMYTRRTRMPRPALIAGLHLLLQQTTVKDLPALS